MLKRLELIGFKSFADRTIFDFAAGITAVVGPNGSGKSNVVDAVKWVLGEQSAKSLRGGDMADVIFNGSASRKGVGVAEVSLTFDNAQSHLSYPGAEVCVTRRVHRDGRGEYLINGQECRLRDIKDLFLGTGAGAGAYSIIEQGQVEALLKSATDDRRAIFEEAAGVSRFKAKKAECFRRLERVGANLTRLRDILGEVDQQLKSARQQAAKAQKHREYSARLRELRVGLGLREYRVLSAQADESTRHLDDLRTTLNEVVQQHTIEAEAVGKLEQDRSTVEMQTQGLEQALAEVNGRIANLENAIARDRAVVRELEHQSARVQARASDLSNQLLAIETARANIANELTEASALTSAEETKLSAATEILEQVALATHGARATIDAGKNEHRQLKETATAAHNEAIALAAKLEQLRRNHERLAARQQQADEQLAAMDLELAGLTRAEADLQSRLAEARLGLIDRARVRDSARGESEHLLAQLAKLRAEASGLSSRIDLLEGLESSREGLGAGIRELLDLVAASTAANPWRDNVIGLVADCLRAPHEVAALIDLALGPLAQCCVARNTNALIGELMARNAPFAGRVTFLPLEGEPVELRTLPQGYEVQRASSAVQCENEELADLPNRLLGTTLLVPNLETAWEIAEDCPGWRFVTAAGEVLEADGVLTVGVHHATAGLLTRKSELREARERFAKLGDTIESLEFDLECTSERASENDSAVDQLREAIDVMSRQEAELRTRVGRHRERRNGLFDEVNASRSQIDGLATEIGRNVERQAEAQAIAEAALGKAAIVQQRIADLEASIEGHEQTRSAAQKDHSAAEVTLAKLRERSAALTRRQEELERDHLGRQKESRDLDERVKVIAERVIGCQAAITDATSELIIQREAGQKADAELRIIVAERNAVREEERRLKEKLQATQAAWNKCREEFHSLELKATEARHRRDTVTSRLAEDYQVDLGQAFEEDRQNNGQAAALGGIADDAARSEIEELRKKLDRLGGVSTESVEELAQIESKAGTLQKQLDDLTNARTSLEEVIDKINTDSKKLFNETFTTIRAHFQDLFRRLFAGGQADIVLDQPDEPLESGIDIVAKPPGKDTRSISLLSGGEKTLTAVALLLAIFRSKPSPFCLLDEVDAVLDEANAARLADMVREFASTSQFIIVTHAKRTMAAADVLYGVTMQESGISKRVAIRFEDWEDERKAA